MTDQVMVKDVTHLREDGHTDVVVAGLVDESGQLVRRDGSGDGFLSGLRRQTHCQVLLMRQQIGAGLWTDPNQSEKRGQMMFKNINRL